MLKKIVVTGPTGAIGMALIKKCIEEKTQVLAICRKGSNRIARIPKSEFVETVECDLPDLNHFPVNGKYDAFYHFAWDGTFGDSRNDMELQCRNIEYALDTVQLAKRFGCHTFIGAGSQAEYGRVEGMIKPETPTFPETGYGIAKLCAGQMTRELCHQQAMKQIWVRILSVYGPYDGVDTMIASTIRKLMNGKKPLFTKGEQIWDYMFSGDAANALYLLGVKGIDGKTYVLGSGTAKPLREYILEIRDAIDPQLEVGLGALPYGEKQVMHLAADISELIRDTGIKDFTSFQDGVRETIKFWNTIKG